MTDEATPVAAPPSAAVIDAPTPSTPELGSQTPVAPKPEAPKAEPKPEPKGDAKAEVSKSAGDAVRKANEALKAKAQAEEKAKTQEKPEAKAPAKPDTKAEPESRARSDDGKFVSKDSPQPGEKAAPAATAGDQTSEGRKPHQDAPARFQEHSKRDWANVPESVQEDVHRVIAENEKGIQKYKASHERYEQFREFDDMAKSNGRDLKESISKLVEFERTMQQNPLGAINYALREVGPRGPDGKPMTIDDIVAHVHGQSNDDRLHAAQQENAQLRQQIERMQSEQRDAETVRRIPDEVTAFASENPRFEELSDKIATLIELGAAPNLAAAYKIAEMFTPASNAGSPPSQPLKPAESDPAQTQAQAEIPLNPAGQKSVSGAPTGGVSPAAKRPVPNSNGEALKRAAARLRS